jgi:hypothetical protein
MLTNELNHIAEMVAEIPCPAHSGTGTANGEVSFDELHFKKLCSRARESWAFAAFNPSSDESLRRYFTYHMIVLTEMTDRDDPYWYDTGILAELTRLTDHLFTYHHRFLEQHTALPRPFLQTRIEALKQKITLIKGKSRLNIANRDLNQVLAGMLKEILELPHGKACTVGSLSYAESFINELNEVLQTASTANAELLVADKLIAMNFNHIRFFLYLEDQLKNVVSNLPLTDQPEELRRQKRLFKQLNPVKAYAANWNSIGEMMQCWITERIGAILESSRTETVGPEHLIQKLGFNLSVAQLACLTKAFYHAGIYLSENITEIFTFSAGYFYSKRQGNISKGSFSKEYYSISQKTAAHVLDLLQKMTATIRHDYFPVFLVISAMHLFL